VPIHLSALVRVRPRPMSGMINSYVASRLCAFACDLSLLLRRRRLRITPTAEATAKAAQLDAGGLEGIAALRADRHHLRADRDIAQLPIDLLAHLAVGRQLHIGGLPVPICDRNCVARNRA